MWRTYFYYLKNLKSVKLTHYISDNSLSLKASITKPNLNAPRVERRTMSTFTENKYTIIILLNKFTDLNFLDHYKKNCISKKILLFSKLEGPCWGSLKIIVIIEGGMLKGVSISRIFSNVFAIRITQLNEYS